MFDALLTNFTNIFGQSALFRLQMLDPDQNETGVGAEIGVYTPIATNFNAVMNVHDLGSDPTASYLTGVIYDDLDLDELYSQGEGKSGFEVKVFGANGGGLVDSTTATQFGSYSLELPDGTYDVVFMDGLLMHTVEDVTIDGLNVKLDATTFTEVPEPSTYLILGSLLGAIGMRRRKVLCNTKETCRS